MNTFEKGVVFSPANTVEYAEGSVVSREILRNNAGTLTLFDGEAEITVGGVVHHPKAGEMLIMPAGVPHALQAVQRFKMLLTMIRG